MDFFALDQKKKTMFACPQPLSDRQGRLVGWILFLLAGAAFSCIFEQMKSVFPKLTQSRLVPIQIWTK